MADLKWIETARKLIGLKEDPREGYTIKKIPEMWDFVNTKIGQTQRLKEKDSYSLNHFAILLSFLYYYCSIS